MVDSRLSKTYTLELTLEGPVCAGSGKKVGKKEYFYNSRQQTVSFYDQNKLMDCIVQQNLMDAYEEYMLGPSRSLYDFFRIAGGAEAFAPALKYTVRCEDAIGDNCGQPADIRTHIRNGAGQVYLPGSSVKGMLRTAITVGCLLKSEPQTSRPTVPEGNPRDRDFKKTMGKQANTSMRQLDNELFHLLDAKPRDVANAVNDIFRGVSIADSGPIPDEDLILCRKADLYPDGFEKELNLIRECVRPGVTVKMAVAIDPTLARFLTADFIRECISLFDGWYTTYVLSHYQNAPGPALTSHLFLGGGSGYFSKTVTAPWLKEDALHYIASWLTAQFGAKNSNDETRYGISPHMLKYTWVGNRLLPFGLCKVELR